MDAYSEGACDLFRLSTGRTFYANGHILGISEGSITGGYDNGIDTSDFTRAERTEVAAWAIRQWEQWAQSVPPSVSQEYPQE
jgi:hypothetical protein